MTATTAPWIVRRYFELASAGNDEAYLELFTKDALVEDEGKEYAGIDAIRAWRADAPSVDYTVTRVEQAGDQVVATCTITGDFPGSPFAGLQFRFDDFDDAAVRVLRIRTKE
ncbi:nuclear transport factor 2 family protein [Streptomyces solisilvae]|uniref:nuclear transport factor 2 family protein n=1 Tax=Streptomyces malaysiensis TaxID=92644 RepID=UPI0036B5C261